jgi:hypothetical protein
VHRASRLFGDRYEHVEVGVGLERLVGRPRCRAAIADEVGSKHAPVGLQRFYQRQPFLVRRARAMTDDDRRSLTLIEISDLDAA